MARHAKQNSKMAWVGAATVLSLLLVTVLSAVGNASPQTPQRTARPVAVIDEAKPHPRFPAAKAVPLTVTVRHGDTLSKIAKRVLGSTRKWPVLWYANRHRVHNPNLITAGETLRVSYQRQSPRMVHMALAAIPRPKPAPVRVRHAAVVQATYSAPATYSGGSGCQAHIIADESGGNPRAVNPYSGAGGLYQFLPSTWAALGHSGLPQNASVAEQNQAYYQEVAQSGYSAWAASGGC